MKNFLLSIIVIALSFSVQAIEPHKGYRGFVDWNNDVNPDISIYGGPTNSKYYTGFSTSHGYQFNRWLYAGGGVAVENFVKENEVYIASIYGHFRSDMVFGRFKPHIDVRLGYNMANYGGIYFCPSIGYRINTQSAFGINIALGMTMTGNRQTIEYYNPATGWTRWHRLHQYDTTFHFRVGFDFQL